MRLNSERGEAAFGTTAVMVGFIAGLNLGNVLHQALDDSDERVKNVQVYNRQLQPQLEVGGKVVASLILNDDGEDFTFRSRSTEGIPQSCKGNYKLANSTATLAGKVTCSEVISVAK